MPRRQQYYIKLILNLTNLSFSNAPNYLLKITSRNNAIITTLVMAKRSDHSRNRLIISVAGPMSGYYQKIIHSQSSYWFIRDN